MNHRAAGVERQHCGQNPTGKMGSGCSVHAAVAPFLRSMTVSRRPQSHARPIGARRIKTLSCTGLAGTAVGSRRGEHGRGARTPGKHRHSGESSSRKAGLTGAVIMLFAAATPDSRPPAAPPLARVRPPGGSRRGHTTDSSVAHLMRSTGL